MLSDSNEVEVHETTPEQPAGKRETSPAGVKTRIDWATMVAPPAGPRSIVTNTFLAVDDVHVLPRETSPATLTQLEFCWGLKYGSLDADSRLNIFRLNLELHNLYKDGSWVLLPEKSVVDDICNGVMPTAQHYQYTLLPSDAMKGYPINRILDPDNEPNRTETHLYPYHTLPPLRTHVHPYFIMFHTGSHLTEVPDLCLFQPAMQSGHLELVFAIAIAYDRWIKSEPHKDKKFMQDAHPHLATEDDDLSSSTSGSSTRTPPRRVDMESLSREIARHNKANKPPRHDRSA